MFIVTKRFGRTETRLPETFKTEAEAVHFIHQKLQDDFQYKILAQYGLYDGADLMREYSQKDLTANNADVSTGSGESAGGKGSSQSFRPSPFSTTLRMGPQSYLKDDDVAKEDKKD